MSCTESDEILAAALLDDVRAQEAGLHQRIATRWDEVYGAILSRDGQTTRRAAIALNFWDGWCDAANHEWHYYSGIAADDWPVFARHIADGLKRGEDATEPRILERFSPEAHRARRVRFRDWLKKLLSL